MDNFTRLCIAVCVAILFALTAGLWFTAVNNSKVQETCGDPSYSSLEHVLTPDQPTVRMIYGKYHSPDTIETTDGNLWALNTDDINEYESLLVWFDDMGTSEIEDDQIYKVWREIYD